MKSFTRVKVINGQEYLYEITPYYDRDKKIIKQRSKYLGKNVNGVPVKVRSQGIPPKKVLNYGEFLPLSKIISDLELEIVLSKVVSPERARVLLALAMDKLLHPHSLRYIQNWYEGTYLAEDHPNLPLSSQSLSGLLKSVGVGLEPLEFSRHLIQHIKTSNTLIYDITSVSSFTQSMSLFEYGYNRDGLDLPQINLSLVVDKQLGIPVLYDVYPGSIVDVSTLKNTIKKIKAEGVKDFTLIMDRGFFSTSNIEELMDSDLSFIIPPASTLKNVKEIISDIHSKIDDPDYLKMYQDEPLFVMPVTIDIGEIKLAGYAYYDQKREQQERNSFYKRLYGVITRLKAINLKPWMDARSVFLETAKKDAKYIEWCVKEGHFDVSLRKNAVSHRVNKMGKFILLYRGKFEWDQCISFYRSKDMVEKGFDYLKNDIEITPLNTKTESTLRGYLFVCFLALIIRMKLQRMIKEGEIQDKYSVDGVITELEKIKLLILPDGQRLVTEITKRQRKILEALGVCA